MPAYRSDAEGEVREAVVARLRALRPTARIMHEVNVSLFGNRVDVLAVDRAEIIAVEIKSAKDRLDRLPDQLKAMKGCAHHSIAALHEKFYTEAVTNQWAAEYERDGMYYCKTPPAGVGWDNTAWRYPVHPKALWGEPSATISRPLPAKALDMLWRAELLEMCSRYRVSCGPRPVMEMMTNALRWQLSGRDLTLGICAALRARACIEADPAHEWPKP